MVGIRQTLNEPAFTYEELQQANDYVNRQRIKDGEEPIECMSLLDYTEKTMRVQQTIDRIYDADDSDIADFVIMKMRRFANSIGEEFDPTKLEKISRGLALTLKYNGLPFLWLNLSEETIDKDSGVLYMSQGYRDLAEGKNRRLQKRKSSFDLMTGKRIS